MSEKSSRTVFDFVEMLGISGVDFSRDYYCSYVYSSAWSPARAWLAFRLCTSFESAPLEVLVADAVALRAALNTSDRQIAIDVIVGWNAAGGVSRLFAPEVI
jgi:hypothetical protein